MFEISDIKALRRKLGLTQANVAKKAKVSQSLIAKIEAGRLDPSYGNAKRILEALQSLTEHNELKAKDIMTARIISANQGERLADVAKLMKRNAVSQILIMQGNSVVGLVAESTILDAVESAVESGKDYAKLSCESVMEPSPPTISKDAPISAIRDLLKHFPLLVVSDRGKPEGVITKADIIAHLGKL